jgi:hypothetical protein
MRPHTVDYEALKDFFLSKELASSVGVRESKQLKVAVWEDGHDYEVWVSGLLVMETTSLSDAIEFYNKVTT